MNKYAKSLETARVGQYAKYMGSDYPKLVGTVCKVVGVQLYATTIYLPTVGHHNCMNSRLIFFTYETYYKSLCELVRR